MTINKTSREMSAKEKYFYTRDAGIEKLSSIGEDTVLELLNWVEYEDVNAKTGEIMQMLAIETPAGVYATNSQTFINEFLDIVKMFEETGELLDSIKLIHGVSKAGRPFLMCGVVI